MTVDRRSLGAIAVTLVLWSSAFAGIQAALEAFTPGHLALFRFLSASAFMGITAVIRRMRLPALRDLPLILLLGLFGIAVYHTALNYAQLRVSAGAAGILIATSPVFTALLAAVFLQERLATWGWLGIVISLGGATLVALGEGGGFNLEPYALLVLISAVSSAVYFVMMKPLLERYTGLELSTYSIWAGTAMLLFFLPGFPHAVASAPSEAVLAVVYLGVLPGGVAYITWAVALSRTPASVLASFQYLVPVLAVLIAWIWRRESPTIMALAGGAVSLLGVILVNRTARRSGPVSPPGENNER
ncbi:MAG: putative inner membrane transporter yiJE [Actinobacteria bacterium ADurb.Bin444]|nr:MAG: putative inner membrane transporter yiJE [Actinobacteria bacterium ADurb.Bin444]